MNKTEHSLIIQCQRNSGERVRKINKFSMYFHKENTLTSEESKYYYIIFSIFHDFITPSSNDQFRLECIPKMKKDIYRLLKKHFRKKLSPQEIYVAHENFINFFDELFELDYSDFKDFRGLYLETIIEKIDKQIILDTWETTSDKISKYIEPTFLTKNSKDANYIGISKLKNDVDIGFVYNNDASQFTNIHLIECKSSLNTFAKNIVYEILKDSPKNIPEISKIYYMREISDKLSAFGYEVMLTMATYDPLISIRYVGFNQEDCKYPITYMKEHIDIIDFNKLIYYLNAG